MALLTIVFAIVVYRIAPDASSTLRTLRDSLSRVEDIDARIIVLDNSPGAGLTQASDGFTHIVFGENRGLAHAYRHAANWAAGQGAALVVTLDQDSVVSAAYLASLRNHARRHAGMQTVFCPTIRSAGRVVSPYVFSASGRPCFDGRPGKLHAINGFSAYPPMLLAHAGIIDDYYWLDGLDFAIYENLHRHRIPVIRLDVEVAHSLSVVDGSIDSRRLAGIAKYEAAFLLQYCGAARISTGLLRLCARVIRLGYGSTGIRSIIAALGAAIAGALAGARRRMLLETAP